MSTLSDVSEISDLLTDDEDEDEDEDEYLLTISNMLNENLLIIDILCELLKDKSIDYIDKVIQIEKILKKYPDIINEKNKDGTYPLIIASIICDDYIVRTLLKYGAQVNQINWMGKITELMLACKYNHSCIRTLLKFGSDPTLVDYAGNSALMWVCNDSIENDEFGISNIEIEEINMYDANLEPYYLEFLLKYGANINYTNSCIPVILLAYNNGCMEYVETLIDYVNIDLEPDSYKYGYLNKILINCFNDCHFELIPNLLMNGARIDDDLTRILNYDKDIQYMILRKYPDQVEEQAKLEQAKFEEKLKKEYEKKFEELKIQLLENLYTPGNVGALSTAKHFEKIETHYYSK
jgi:ankyrin repeat protein